MLFLPITLTIAAIAAMVASAAPLHAQAIRVESGAAAIDPNEPPLPDERVLVIHDSIGLGARAEINAAFPNSEVNYLGFVGFRADVAAELLAERPGLVSDRVVVQLGSNYDISSQFASHLDLLMAQLSGADHVTWLSPPRYVPVMNAVTAAIDSATRQYGNLQLADWGAESDANANYTWDDGIHLRREGALAMAEMMRSHIEGDVPWNRIPIGAITSTRDGRRALTVSGWAFDPDLGRRANVRLLVNGELVEKQRTSETLSDVAEFLGTDITALGFSSRLELPDGEHRICVEVNNFDDRQPVTIACKTVELAHQPFGSFDRVVDNGENRVVRGWAIDPDSPHPVTIEIRKGKKGAGKLLAEGLADRERQDLERLGHGTNRGFAIKIPADADDYCVVARNEFAGTDDTVLGCR